MNAIKTAVDKVAIGICQTLEEMAKDTMFDTDYSVGDRLRLVKAALCMNKFLDDEDNDALDLLPILKDYEDDWHTDDYFTFAEAFITLTEGLYLDII